MDAVVRTDSTKISPSILDKNESRYIVRILALTSNVMAKSMMVGTSE